MILVNKKGGARAAMNLRAAVDRYLEVVREFGKPMPLGEFELPGDEVEGMISAWEEDYHLNRHFELIPLADAARSDSAPTAFRIGGNTYTAIIFRPSIRHVFE